MTKVQLRSNDPETVCSSNDFADDVYNHKMQVINDDGVNRHLEFKDPNYGFRWFGLVTWPGHICFYGDMGTYTFRRLTDMFDFFRQPNKPENFSWSYMAEKLTSVDRSNSMGLTTLRDGVIRWSSAAFYDTLDEAVKDYVADCDVPDDFANDIDPMSIDPDDDKGIRACYADHILADVRSHVLDSDDSRKAIEAVMDYEHVDGTKPFANFYESYSSCTEYDYHFLWCCRAIRWAVQQYDAHNPTPTTED